MSFCVQVNLVLAYGLNKIILYQKAFIRQILEKKGKFAASDDELERQAELGMAVFWY